MGALSNALLSCLSSLRLSHWVRIDLPGMISFFVAIKYIAHQMIVLRWCLAFQSAPLHFGLIEVCTKWDFLPLPVCSPSVVVIRCPSLSTLTLANAPHHPWRQISIGCTFLAH